MVYSSPKQKPRCRLVRRSRRAKGRENGIGRRAVNEVVKRIRIFVAIKASSAISSYLGYAKVGGESIALSTVASASKERKFRPDNWHTLIPVQNYWGKK